MFPNVNKSNASKEKVMLSSQSLDQLPIISGAQKRSKRRSQDNSSSDVNTRSKSKRPSLEGKMDNYRPPARSKRISQNAHQSDSEEDEDGLQAKKKTKTNRVKINPKKFTRQFSSAVYASASGKSDNPLRKFLTKHISEPQTPAATTDIQMFWIYAVTLVSRTAFLTCLTNSPCAFASPLAIDTAKRRLRANLHLVQYIKQRCQWFRKKIKTKTDFVRNHGWKLLLFWRCIQRRKAVTLLRRMLTDYESFRLPYVMLRYRVNAVHLQRYVRSFLEVTESRKRALLMKWHKIAAHMKANLIPFLFEQKLKEEERRKRQDREKWQGVEISNEVLPNLGARVNLVTKRTAALQIKIHESEATIQKHRMEMFVKRNKKKKSSPMKLPPMGGHSDSSRATDSPTRKRKESSAHGRGGRHGHSREEMDESRLISTIVSKFLYECRRTCKFVEHHKVIVREKKRKEGMTCEEAKRILTNAFAAQTFAEGLSNTEVKVEKMRLLIFTGQQSLDFRLLVENYLRGQNSFELKEHCTDYEIFHKSKGKDKDKDKENDKD